jgi:hypothetical protein
MGASCRESSDNKNYVTMKEVVVILSHADTDEKKYILKNCISEIKNQNYDIILSSHISVDKDILNSVDYFILDLENPVVYYNEYEKYNIKPMFLYYNQEQFSFNIQFEMNHGYAVFKLIANAASICNLNDYQKIHFVNYDYIVSDKDLLPFHSALLNKYDVISYILDSRIDLISAGLFSIKTEFLLEKIQSIKKIEDYFNFCHTNIFEDFLFVLFNSGNIKHISDISKLKDKNKIDLVHISTKKPIKKTGENLLLFITREKNNEGDFFLLFMVFDEKNVQITIEFEDCANNLILPKYKPFLVKVKKDWLDSGIKFQIPDYEYEETFYSDRNIGFCVADPSILYDFDEFKNICKLC